ncbi:hypothetical protein AC578_9009 [Pseudocercospora eumusae]|uniref:Inositol polyphosphate-related phosphatase domain-containing protein n=1 Tax=Pseudocercospora eumusae TaxID=321146 RepID=A0A139H2Q0_9PEZI|nr:hypothetical protein AC578_9009 [Pseudocercospora eumusae]
MEGQGDGPDTSSIKPISSLRSRFENLGKEKDNAPPSPTVASRLGANGTAPAARPKTTGGEPKSVAPGLPTVGGAQAMLAPTPRKPQPQTPRPVSMRATSPKQSSPPLLAVTSPKSPRSPHKAFSVDLRPSGGSSPLQPLTPNRTGESTGRAHSRNISRSATPALEARMNAFLQAADTHVVHRSEELSKSAQPESKPQMELKPGTASAPSAPPPVNRAAKPKVPVKPTLLAQKTGNNNLAAPEPNAELSDQSASPFSTPPSSGGSSPAIAKDAQAKGTRARNESNASAVNRVRQGSDASWVSRLRGDSDASFAERARSGSNASFVEPSSLPDSWLPNPVTRTGTMPARYWNMPGRDGRPQEDIVEDRPRLPTRPELQVRSGRVSPPKTRSGRTSPLKSHMLPPRRSVDGLKRAAADLESGPRIPAVPKMNTRSALTQGFDRKGSVASSTASPIVSTPIQPPAVPAPRRSVDRRREPPPPPLSPSVPTTPITNGGTRLSKDDYEDFQPQSLSREGTGLNDFPDGTKANRRAPKFKQRPWQIPTEYDTRLFAVCGEYVCTTGYITKAWNFRTGEQLLNMEHRENIKVTSLVFKPSPDVEDEGKRIWLGTNAGDIHEVDINSQSLVKTKSNVHTRREVIRMFRYASELWTLDDGGELYVWKPNHKGMPSLDSQCNNWRVPKGHSFSMAVGHQLWYATGKDIRVFMPGANSDTEFQLTRTPLSQSGTGDVTSGATLNHQQDLIYFGHSDGKCSIYSRRDFSCQAIVNVSVYRISSLAGVGEYLWAGYSTGMAYVYDTSTTPWTVKKDWKAHDKQICSIVADPSAMWKMGRLNVITLGLDNLLKIWDGMLQDDWLEARMSARDSDYCAFRELTAAVMTWNAGAAKPSYLQHSREDSNFFREYLSSRKSPDIFVFGFQELVDLEDKKVTAKSFFKKSKKEPDVQQHMSHQYRAWRDYLGKCIDDYMPTDQTYTLLHTASMVGLFTCVFVKSAERSRIRYVHTAEVKRGMGGMHGNKGAIIVRMVLDDSSLCFINCHLAAGQTQTMHRNNDIAEILEANALPSYPLNDGEAATHTDVFAAGGDGSMIMDHEICILNGDLNYRIDTMGRDSVIKHIQQGNLARLLERDQLLLSRRKNPGFRLRAFIESPINFAPTYKYNVHTDEYDTSEKRRSPAWCDRILYRGLGKVKMDEYRRWDQIRVSDHRPVSGHFRLRVKCVDPDKREIVWDKCVKEFESVRQRIARAAQLEYLTNVLGLTQKEAVAALQGAS